MMLQEKLLSIENLSILLPEGSDRNHAIKNINIDLHAGETVCIVGESGSGKSLTARAVMGLLPAPHVRVENGKIIVGVMFLLVEQCNSIPDQSFKN